MFNPESGSRQPENEISQETFEKPQVLTEEKTEQKLLAQGQEVSEREKKYPPSLLEKMRKWVAPAVLVLGTSFVASGCGEKKSSDGFIDNSHANVQQRLKIKQMEIKHDRESSRQATPHNNRIQLEPNGRIMNPNDL